MALAVAQQFHDRAWRSPAGDDRVTRSLNAGNIEDGHGLIGVRRAGRYSKCCYAVCFSLCRCERGRALISSAGMQAAQPPARRLRLWFQPAARAVRAWCRRQVLHRMPQQTPETARLFGLSMWQP
jgi:hypothetical protein